MTVHVDPDVTMRVGELWEEILGDPPAGPDENFFDHGGTSIDAARLVVRIRTELCPGLSLQAMFRTPTVNGLLAAVRTAGSGLDYVSRLRTGAGATLVLGPDLNGIQAHIDGVASPVLGRGVVAVASQGVDGEAEPRESVAEIADHVLSRLLDAGVDEPCHLLGNCLGGLIMLEAAKRAARFGIEVRSVVLIGTDPHPERLSRREMVRQRLQAQRRYAGLAPSAELDRAAGSMDEDALVELAFAEMLERGTPRYQTLEAFRIRFRLFVATWTAVSRFEHTPLQLPVRVFHPAGDGAADGFAAAWSALGYRHLTTEARPRMVAEGIAEPANVAAVASFLAAVDDGVAPAG